MRALLRRAGRACLATRLAAARAEEQLGEQGKGGDWPYASLVLVAHDHDGSPLLLISDLADHTRNLAADPQLALLYDGTAGWREPLAGPRATLLGRADRCDDDRLRARFLARHPGAELYAGFADFHLYRVTVSRAHLVAGFGAIHWIAAEEVLLDCSGAAALAEAESEILVHMNQEHAEAVALIARHLVKAEGEGWRLCGVDPEGIDFEREGRHARLDFAAPVDGPESCRKALVGLAKEARDISESSQYFQ
ncbi:MAG: HugZ family protein [Kiloniellales bacterium]